MDEGPGQGSSVEGGPGPRTARTLCIVTGANSGIGKACCLSLAVEGATVIMACRSQDRGQAALDGIVKHADAGIEARLSLWILDMSLLSSVRAFVDRFVEEYANLTDAFDTVVLINNAAPFNIFQAQPEYTSEGYESIFATNYLGPWLLATLLLKAIDSRAALWLRSDAVAARASLHSVESDSEGAGGVRVAAQGQPPEGGGAGDGSVAAGSSISLSTTPACAFRVLNVSSLGLAAHPFMSLGVRDVQDVLDMPPLHSWTAAKAYYRSKLALQLFTVHLSQLLGSTAPHMHDHTVHSIMVPAVRVDPERLAEQGASKCMLCVYKLKSRASIEPEGADAVAGRLLLLSVYSALLCEEMAQGYVAVALAKPEVAKAARGASMDKSGMIMSDPRPVRVHITRGGFLQSLWQTTEKLIAKSPK